jgi:hypothetical protein
MVLRGDKAMFQNANIYVSLSKFILKLRILCKFILFPFVEPDNVLMSFVSEAALKLHVYRKSAIDQWFSTGGTRKVIWWYAKKFRNHNFLHDLILKMLIALLKFFTCNEKKNIMKYL